MMPADVTSASATLTGPGGPIATCVLHKGNTAAGTARDILDGENAVVVVPRTDLADGVYTVGVSSNGGNATWSFTVNRSAPLSAAPPPPPPAESTAPTASIAKFSPVTPFRFIDSRLGQRTSRLPANSVTRIHVTSDSNIVAVSANFVSTGAGGAGHLTLYNCTTNKPLVSTLGYKPGDVVANQALVPLANGDMCIYSLESTDVVVDINGYYRKDGGAGYTPITPARLYDSRDPGGSKLTPGQELVLPVAGVTPGAPAGSSAVALNLTAIVPDWYGWMRIYPCGSTSGSQISSINFAPGEVRANTVVTPVASNGTVCVSSSATVDLALDLMGYFGNTGGYQFQPLAPVRMFDSRLVSSDLNQVTNSSPVGAGQVVRLRVAGTQGVPAGAKAASVNITAVSGGMASHVTAYPCGTLPDSSNLNVAPAQTVTANGAMVKLSSTGDLCVFAKNPTHIIVDINGVWL
jgi:hypothetical protein